MADRDYYDVLGVSKGASQEELKRAFGHDLELVPVHIDNLNRVLPRGEFLPVPLLSCLTFGPPIWLERGETKEQFLRRARQCVLRLKDV